MTEAEQDAMQAQFDRIMSEADERRTVRRAEAGQINLGQLIELLKTAKNPDKAVVMYDFGNLTPTKVNSWRGVYAHLALNYVEAYDSKNGEPLTVAAWIKRLEDCIGEPFEGYKGGTYTMGKDTPMWVANYGNSGGTAVTGLNTESEWAVLITTAYLPY